MQIPTNLIQIQNIINRNKELFWNIVGSFGVKGLAMLVNFASLPAYLSYFPDQRILGVWFTIISVFNWLLTFDLGIGNGLRNLIVQPLLQNDFQKVKEYISTAYITIGLICLILGIIFFISIQYIDWNNMLNVSIEIVSMDVLRNSISVILSTVLLQLFLRLILSILYALEKTTISNSLSLISNLLILIFLLTNKEENVSSKLFSLCLVYFLAINIPLFVASILVFGFTALKNTKPNITSYRSAYSSKILKLGFIFLAIQISLLIINSADELLILKLYSPEDVVGYQVYFKIFSIFLVLFSLITIPIWSAVTRANEEKRFLWIRKIYKLMNITGVLFMLMIVLTILFFRDIIFIWIGSDIIEIKTSTTILFGLYYSMMIFIYSANCLANGMSKLKPQLIITSTAALIKIPLIIILSKYYNNWNIVVIINIFLMIPALIIQPTINIKELKEQQLFLSTRK